MEKSRKQSPEKMSGKWRGACAGMPSAGRGRRSFIVASERCKLGAESAVGSDDLVIGGEELPIWPLFHLWAVRQSHHNPVVGGCEKQ